MQCFINEMTKFSIDFGGDIIREMTFNSSGNVLHSTVSLPMHMQEQIYLFQNALTS